MKYPLIYQYFKKPIFCYLTFKFFEFFLIIKFFRKQLNNFIKIMNKENNMENTAISVKQEQVDEALVLKENTVLTPAPE